MDEKEFKAKLEEHDRRQATRQVEQYIADTAYDTVEASKPRQSRLENFITCDNLRVSLESLRESVSGLSDTPEHDKLAAQAEIAEDKALTSVPTICRVQLDRFLDADKKPQPSPPPPPLI